MDQRAVAWATDIAWRGTGHAVLCAIEHDILFADHRWLALVGWVWSSVCQASVLFSIWAVVVGILLEHVIYVVHVFVVDLLVVMHTISLPLQRIAQAPETH